MQQNRTSESEQDDGSESAAVIQSAEAFVEVRLVRVEFVNSQAKQMRFSQDMLTLRQILKVKVTAEADL